MFFDGSHDSKKKISLGGKSRGKAQESKSDFLERTKREREERELAKRRERAALSIQAFQRARKHLIMLRDSERNGWDDLLDSIAQDWITNHSSSQIPFMVMKRFYELTTRFLFFYREWLVDDRRRLAKLIIWLTSGKSSSSAGPPALPLLISTETEHFLRQRRIFRLCSCCIDRLRLMGDQPCYSVIAAAAAAIGPSPQQDIPMRDSDGESLTATMDCLASSAFILRLSDPSCWPKGDATHSRLLERLLDLGLMPVVRANLDRLESLSSAVPTHRALNQQLCIILCGSVAHALRQGSPAALEGFCSWLLTASSLHTRLPPVAIQTLEFAGLWERVLDVLAQRDGALIRRLIDTGSAETRAALLGNLLELIRPHLAVEAPHAIGRFATCAGLLLQSAWDSYRRALATDDADAMNQDDEDEGGAGGASRVAVRSNIEVETAAGRAVVQHVRFARSVPAGGGAAAVGWSRKHALHSGLMREHVAVLCSRDFVFRLLNAIQRLAPMAGSSGGGGVAAGAGREEQSIVSGTVGLLLQLTCLLSENRTEMLNVLAFKPDILSMLWDCVRSYSSSGSGEAAAAAAAAAEPAMLTLFCLIYNHLLLTSDFSEFFDRQFPFSLHQVREILHLIRTVVIPIYWTGPVVGGAASVSASASGSASASPSGLHDSLELLREAGTALLAALLERNCYREFAPASDWLAPERLAASVVAELDTFSPHVGNLDAVIAGIVAAGRPTLAPRHQVLLERAPFALPFTLRVRVLRHMVMLDRLTLHRLPASLDLGERVNTVRATIQRSRVLEDSFRELNRFGGDLRRIVQVRFVNQEGLEEAGMDGGGLFKEFLNTLVRQAFNPHYGLFCLTPDGLLYPNPQAETAHPWQGSLDHLRLFEFLGRMVGKAMYEGILVELRLAPFFLRRMLGQALHFDDLLSLDPDLHKNLLFVRNYEGDFEDLALNFVVVEDKFGAPQTVELIPDGATVAVTRDNVLLYRHLASDYWLNKRIRAQAEAFMRGLKDLVRPEWVRAFSPLELQTLLAGVNQEVDMDDLRANCVYGGGYFDAHPSIVLFWEVAKSLDAAEREALLLFATSCSRPPLLGFRDLQPPFCILKTVHPPEEADSRLPTAATCHNLLKLPAYTNAADLKARLLYAVSANAGFELT